MTDFMKKRKIGILGGTFNPIHNGHLILAENAYSYCNLDNVLVMPSGCSYLKKQDEIASKNDRINMVSLAINNNDHLSLSTIETERDGNSYTVDTLTFLKDANPDTEFFYIIGDDTLFSMETWYKPEEIFNKATIVVAPRDYSSFESINIKKNELIAKYKANIIILETPNIDISSHMLRSRIKNNISIRYYVPDSVNEYILENNLYK